MPTNSITKLTRALRYFHAILISSLVIFTLLLVFCTYIIIPSRVDGHSMDTTLKNGQPIFINHLAYRFQSPKKNDVIVLAYQGNPKVRFVKRIINTPGNKVDYNGTEITLASDQYFVMGDNRDFSTDSRVYGPIRFSQIIGRVIGY